MFLSTVVSIAAFFVLLWLLRHSRYSLGLPLAYMFGLLLIHLPGAVPYLVGSTVGVDEDLVGEGMQLAAIGAVGFVLGAFAYLRTAGAAPAGATQPTVHYRRDFWLFCLLAGWGLIYGLAPFVTTPSVGAAVTAGGGIWMFGVLLALRYSLLHRKPGLFLLWSSAMLVYPVLMLLIGGFLSYGASAFMTCSAVLTLTVRRYSVAVIGIVVVALLGLSTFAAYFQGRDAIRDAVWGGASLETRVSVIGETFSNIELFDPTDPLQATALNERLNQNVFVGLASARIESGAVEFLYGRSLRDALYAFIPRIIWPEKPVFGGSPDIVREMTGLQLSDTTSFGVGNVMEFYINFGVIGLLGGCGILGFVLTWLDRRAAVAESTGNLSGTFKFFLPAIALIQPNGSMVEIASGSAAAAVAAFASGKPGSSGSLARIRANRHAYSRSPLVDQHADGFHSSADGWYQL